MKFVDPKNDVAFKKIFGSEHKTEILISFLNAVLDLTDDHEIQTVQILNPFQTPEIKILKSTILDVRATDKRGVTFIVEMQAENKVGLKKCFTYYASKAYISQIERGSDYPKLNQVVFIGVLDFNLFSSTHYLTRHWILNTETHERELEDLEFNFIELPKFTKSEDEIETILEKWVYFIKHAADLTVVPANADTAPLQAAYEMADHFNWTREELDLYDYWDIKEQDIRGAIQFAAQVAAEENLQKGRREGLQEGKQKQAIATAREMLADGLDHVAITKYTGLSPEEITALLRAQDIALSEK
ncbi:MAG: Rpn family recombination-promoting nuclease/putative transposase [Anaerolineae bacterium]|nr:Rpn family recombination-promoting nuclease/putative transposase [Anaerolineae bacterium]